MGKIHAVRASPELESAREAIRWVKDFSVQTRPTKGNAQLLQRLLNS
jgi:hypothetical protein